MNREHWDNIYTGSSTSTLSWYQSDARLSQALIHGVTTGTRDPIIDVGAGASVLVDALLADGYKDLSVLDVSAAALRISRDRLGTDGDRVQWLAADVLDTSLAEARYAVWHDRAVFHFLTRSQDRQRYVAQVKRALKPGAPVVMATFAANGPSRCSGLDVVRYSPEALHQEFGAGFGIVAQEREEHRTPAGMLQAFTYCVFQWSGTSPTESPANHAA